MFSPKGSSKACQVGKRVSSQSKMMAVSPGVAGFPRCGLGLGPFGFGHFKGLGFKRYNRTGTISGYSYKLLLGLGIVGLGTAPSKLRA